MNLMCIISLYNYWGKGFISSSLWKIILLSNDECTLTKRFKSNSTKAVALIPYLFFYSKWANWKWEHTSLEQTRLAGLLGLPSEPLHSHSSQPARPLGSNWASPLDAALLDTCWEHSMQWAIGMRIQKVWKPWMLLLLLGNLQCSPARCVLWNCPDVACLTKACTTRGKQSARPANWCKHIHRTGLPSASWGQNVPRCLFLYQLLLTVHLNWRNIILFFFFFPLWIKSFRTYLLFYLTFKIYCLNTKLSVEPFSGYSSAQLNPGHRNWCVYCSRALTVHLDFFFSSGILPSANGAQQFCSSSTNLLMYCFFF